LVNKNNQILRINLTIIQLFKEMDFPMHIIFIAKETIIIRETLLKENGKMFQAKRLYNSR